MEESGRFKSVLENFCWSLRSSQVSQRNSRPCLSLLGEPPIIIWVQGVAAAGCVTWVLHIQNARRSEEQFARNLSPLSTDFLIISLSTSERAGASPPSQPRASLTCSIAFTLKAILGEITPDFTQLGVGKVGLLPLLFSGETSLVQARP